MAGDSIDSGHDARHYVGGDPDPDLLSELEWVSHGGLHAGSHG
jgi:hypothetical protein